MAQTFQEFELVVADNDDTDQTSVMLESFQDRRLKVVRTGGLGMVDNWNAALDSAQNEWVLLIEDKILLPPDCLDRLRKIVASDAQSPFVTWCIKTIADVSDLRRISGDSSRVEPVHKLQSADILQLAAECRFDSFQRVAPRAINTLARRSFVDSAQQRHGRFFRAMNPDYNFAFRALGSSEFYLHTNEHLSAVLLGAPSNGDEVARRKSSAKDFFAGINKTEKDCLDLVSVKLPIIPNFILNDYLHFVQETGFGETPDPLDYCAMLLAELVVMRKRGTPIGDFMRELSAYLSAQGLDFRSRLVVHLSQLFVRGWPNRRLRMRNNARDFIVSLRLVLFGQ